MSTMTTQSGAANLALPVGDRSLPARSLVLGAVAAGAAGISLVGALAAAYIGLRAGAAAWLPADYKVDGFLGVMLTLTAVMSMPFAIWAVGADARGLRRQASTALALTAFVGFCLLNGIWYFGTQLGLGAASSAFATANYALLGGIGAFVGIALVGLLAALAKVGGRQTGPHFSGAVKAAAWLWMTSQAGWIIVWSTLFLLK